MKKKLISAVVVVVVIVVGILLYNEFFSTYDVIFDSKGGTSIQAERIKKNQVVSEPPTPVLEGYVFDGWLLDGNPYDFSQPVTKSITLTGSWHRK